MATLSIHEMRRLVLPIETVVEAVLQFDRDSGGRLSQGTILDATIESGSAPSLLLVVRPRRSDTVEHRAFSMPAIAAAIINYCRQTRIPLPRGGKKSVEVVPEGLAFCIQNTINLPRLHTGLVQRPRTTTPPTAPDTPPSQTPAPEPSDAINAA